MKTQNIDGQASARGIAVVTGASSGLGKVHAQDLQKQSGIQANILVADLGLATDLKRVVIPHSARANLGAA
jgi:NAD(P)-dependent dehydrogenase (short-subunit alcohol dehydrogenase family)